MALLDAEVSFSWADTHEVSACHPKFEPLDGGLQPSQKSVGVERAVCFGRKGHGNSGRRGSREAVGDAVYAMHILTSN